MRCTNCGAEMNSGDKFCPYCGKAFKEEKREKEKFGICPSCGKKNSPEDSFCAYCGAPLLRNEYDNKEKHENKAARHNGGEDKHRAAGSGYNQNNRKNSGSQKSDNNEKVKTVIAVAGAVFIIIIVLAVGFILSSGSDEDDIIAGGGFKNEISEEADSSMSEEEVDFSVSEAEAAVNNELEEKIEQIREEYGDIVFNITNDAYDEIEISNGIKAYYSGSTLCAVIISAGTDNSNYIKTYYYSGGELICAYYEGADAQRFYFSGGRLILQRYFPNTSDVQTYTDYDTDDNTWEATVLSEAENLRERWQSVLLNSNSESKAEETTQGGVYVYNPPIDYYDDITPSDNGESVSSNSGIESEMSALIYNYCSSLCSAINAGSYSLVSRYIAPGSSLETSQKSLVSRLYSDGTTEELVSCNVTNVVSTGTSTYYVYVTETEKINYVSKGTKTNTYNWKYTAVYTGGQWKLSNIEQA